MTYTSSNDSFAPSLFKTYASGKNLDYLQTLDMSLINVKIFSVSIFPLYLFKLFHDGDLYHVETRSLIYFAKQWIGFYIIGTSLMKELSTGITISPIRDDNRKSIDFF